jgi:hypothetical protein
VVAVVEGDGDPRPLLVLRGGGWDRHDLPGGEFLLPPWLIGVGSTVDVVDLLVSFGEVTLWIFRLLLLINLFGRFEHLICETLESVIVPSLVLSLGVKNVDLIQEAIKFTRPGSVLLVATRLLYVGHGAVYLLFLSWLLELLGWSEWPNSLSFFCSLVSRVTSSARTYLLAIANIPSDVLGFFMASLWIKDESLLEEYDDWFSVDL